MEQVIRREGPQNANDSGTERFLAAIKHIDEMRDYRDRLFDQLYKFNNEGR